MTRPRRGEAGLVSVWQATCWGFRRFFKCSSSQIRAPGAAQPLPVRQNRQPRYCRLNIRDLLKLALWAGLVVASLGCSPGRGLVGNDQVRHDAGPLEVFAGQTVGQTFVARYQGLSGVEVYLEPDLPGDGRLVLHLRSSPEAGDDLAKARVSVAAVQSPGFYRFLFSPFPDSEQAYYYAFLELKGAGRVRVGRAGGGAFLDGVLYEDHVPQDSQLAFRLVYGRKLAGLGLVKTGLQWMGYLLVGLFLFVIPGWAIIEWVWPDDHRLSWGEKLGLAGGISLAIYPLLLLWAKTAGLRLGALNGWLPPSGGLAWLAWKWSKSGGKENHRKFSGSIARRLSLRDSLPTIALALMVAFVFGSRFWALRGLEGPLWGDSVQHAVISQLLVDRGGLFDSWLPYAPYTSLTVHFGFHSATAAFSWVTGLSGIQATLLAGQLLNGLAVFALYPLAVKLAQGNRWAGVGAVFVAGLLSPLPAFYINWGRYSQLAGQVVLPVAIWVLWQTAESNKGRWKAVLLTGFTVAGMSLAYYRMPFYLAAFVVAWLVGWGISRWKSDWRKWWHGLGPVLVAGLVSGLLIVPWAANLLGGNLAQAVVKGTAIVSPLAGVVADYQVWKQVTAFVPGYLLALAVLSLVAALVRKRWMVAALGLWVAILASLVAGRLIGFPGANMLQNFAIVIALYIPVGLSTGWLLGEGVVWFSKRFSPAGGLISTLVLIILAGWAAWGRSTVAEPKTYAMLTRPDVRAMAWIRENTPPEATFLVEGFRIYGGTTAVGSDAGWWLPLLTGRANSMPPQYALFNEKPAKPGFSGEVVSLVQALEGISPGSSEGVRRLCEMGVTHVFIGQRQGETGFQATSLFTSQDFSESAAFELLYHQDRVYVFALVPKACEGFR